MAVSSAIMHSDAFNCSTESTGSILCSSCRQSRKTDQYKHILYGFSRGNTEIDGTHMMWWIIAGYFEPAKDVGGTLQKMKIKWNRFFSLKSLTSLLPEHVLIQSHSRLHIWVYLRMQAGVPRCLSPRGNQTACSQTLRVSIVVQTLPCLFPIVQTIELRFDLFSLFSSALD